MSTGIQWTDETWNPTRGCSRVSKGCENCYAEVVAARFSGKGQAYEGLARRTSKGEARWTGKVVVVDKQVDWPLRWKGSARAREEGRSSRIFVDSMSDLFHEKITDDELDRIFAVMALADRHTFQILTKRPDRMREYFAYEFRWAMIEGNAQALYHERTGEDPSMWLAVSGPLPNVWLGVSAENQETADERIPILVETPAAVRFLSCEPLLGPIDFYGAGSRGPEEGDPESFSALTGYKGTDPIIPGIDWVIVGGESGSDARPCRVKWIREIMGQCTDAKVPVFVKQMGKWILGDHSGFTVNRWLLEDGRVFVLPLLGANAKAKPCGAIAFGNCDTHGGNWIEWPDDLKVREFPKEAA